MGGDSTPLGMIHGVIKASRSPVAPPAPALPGSQAWKLCFFAVSEASEPGICLLDSDLALLVHRVSVVWGRCSRVDVR